MYYRDSTKAGCLRAARLSCLRRHMRLRKGFWIYFPVALFAWLSPVTSVKADALGNWTFSESNSCGGYVEVVDSNIILHGPDNQIAGYGACGGQAHWVKIETTIPADVDTIDFTWTYQTNDGWVYDPPQYGINGTYTLITQQNSATGSLSVPVQEGDIFTFRQYSIDTCCQPGHLTISDLSLWTAAPETTTSSTTSTTTTTTSTTTIPPTTTTESTTTTSTEPQTTTTSTSSTSTTLPETSTTLVENTTSTTTTSTSPPAPEPPVEVPTTTTTTTIEEAIPETTLPEETTTTTEPSPETTVEETTTTTLEPNLEPNLEPLTEEEINTVVEELTTIEEITPEVLSEVVNALNSDSISEEQVQAIVDAVVDNLDTLTEITPEVLDEVLNVLESDSVTDKQVQDIVDTILATDINTEQATQLATSAAVLENITGDQATEVFASIDTGELSGEEASAIIEALLEAPTEVKEAFEEEINVFEGGD